MQSRSWSKNRRCDAADDFPVAHPLELALLLNSVSSQTRIRPNSLSSQTRSHPTSLAPLSP